LIVGSPFEKSETVGKAVGISVVFAFAVGEFEGMLLGKLLPEGKVDGSVMGSLLMVGS